jgi:cyclic beta-1,2-glucan synthetase
VADDASELAWALIPAAQRLSEHHRIVDGAPSAIPAWEALSASRKWLHDARLACAKAQPGAGKAAEWLLDNDYQVHRAIREIRHDLPASFYVHLPAVADGDKPAVPRIFALAHDLLRITRLQISMPAAVDFVRAYQQRQTLTIAELWAFPTMLRIACLEILVGALTPMLNGEVELPFAPSRWALDPHGVDETGRVARGIANLGTIAAIRWEEFFDATSRVEEMLIGDPSGFYQRMDFETRDRCRRSVEEIARHGRGTEVEIAAHAVRLAETAGEEEAGRHVGHWLIGCGRRRLEKEVGVRYPTSRQLREFVLRRPGSVYAGALALCAAGAMLLPATYLLMVGAGTLGWIAGLAAAFVPATILAITVVHWAITRALPPRVLAKLDFEKGLPADCRTVVAVPVLVARDEEVAGLIGQIEGHWLANADPRLRIALLVDLADAQAEHHECDVTILKALRTQVTALNKQYGRNNAGPFHLLVRPRQFNASEDCWMAWERKRGKLEQFNRMLVEGRDDDFSLRIGDRAALHNTRFVITVDADTMLPPGSVAALVGTLAHPLNQPRFDEATGRITSGYSIIQPRTEISPQSGMRTLFTRLFTGDTAIDIYSRAVSDVYQDLFGAGIFVGKGIYDVQAFHRSVDGRVPENAILSHDLFEGAHGRVALATDIVLYEGFPGTYLEYARRLHRWVRGDWQLLPWLGRSVPTEAGQRETAFAGIDRWKILDNLRRSLIAPSMLALALAGWFLLPGSPWFWTLLAVFAPAGQLFTDLISGLSQGRRRGAVRGILNRLSDQAGRWFLAIIYLLHEALLSLHAIGVTLWRLAVSRRRLLEWTSAAQVASTLSAGGSRGGLWRRMWIGPAIAGATSLALALLRPEALLPAMPLMLLWIAAPEISFRIGRPPRLDVTPLAAEDVPYLRALARRTWLYFETFAGPDDQWLPPDNYQDEPHEEIAHRTSPTNIGMMLLSTATAWDLGYLGRGELAARTESVFDSLDKLERHRGHFFNWYDTRTLKPLEPRYLSAVDSGNLAVSLIAFARALEESASSDGLEPQRWAGLEDVIAILTTPAADLAPSRLTPLLDDLRGRIGRLKEEVNGWLFGLVQICDEYIPEIETVAAEIATSAPSAANQAVRELYVWLDRLRHQASAMLRDLGQGAGIADSLHHLAGRAREMANAMDFRPLYDRDRRLFFIGHNLSTGRIDPHHYDLLASEARLASFFAIAKGDVPVEHWFHLGRPVTRAQGGLTLISWNGSMFEYLMPRLLLRSGPESLLGESERIAVRIQRRHGEAEGLPWGVSESAFAARDPDHRYRYQAFGVPGLGLRRGLGQDRVVAPYASALALAVAPAIAAANLRALDRLGASGVYGLMEAVDFTPDRLAAGERFAPVAAWMAHHQGMILCAIGNVLTGDALVRRFTDDPRMRLASLLLSERIPREIVSEIDRIEEQEREPMTAASARMPAPWRPDPAAAFPQMQLLGNGRLASWISTAGGGGLRWRGQALTRFVPDATRDAEGLWLYLADVESGELWSATRQPTQTVPDEYRVLFHGHMVEFHRRDHGIECRLEVAAAAGDDLEMRRVSLTNESDRPRWLRVTSYGEVVLAPPLEDERHPAFSKLFVGSELVPHLGGLLFARRSRNPRETPPFLLHFLVGAEGPIATARWESDRRAFIGRGGDLRAPAGARASLGNSAGFTLDPVMALQLEVELRPYERRELCFVSVVAATREAVIETAERYATLASLDWAIGDAATESARAVERAGLDPDALAPLQALASQLVYPHGPLRANTATIRANRLGQTHLWGLALSGDLPIVVLRAAGSSVLLSRLIRAQQYWRRSGLEFDLVVLQAGGSAYVEPMRDEIADLLRSVGAAEMLGRRAGIHLLFADQIGAEQVRLLEAAAHVVLDDGKDLEGQLLAEGPRLTELPGFAPSRPPEMDAPMPDAPSHGVPLFDNGIGGFSPDGREYVIRLRPGATSPAPWANILANETFGTLVTEAGGGFSWSGNSGENRLTPWTNDPVSDRPGESLFLRDEETASVWTVTPGTGGREAACEIRHGAGYTIWRRHSHGLEQEMLVFVPVDAPVKLVRLRVRNLLARHRRITSTYYAEWLLGALASVSRRHVTCDRDEESHALLASSQWSADFASSVAFLAASRAPHGFTTDRREFLGSEGDPAKPAGLARWGLSGRIVAGEDPCAAYQVHHDLAPHSSDEIVFVLGQGTDEAEAKGLARRWSDPDAVEAARVALDEWWEARLGAVEMHSPDQGFDLMVNRWLPYQSLSARLLARTGFYQSSGAFGFRDQLQDVLAFLHTEPTRVRAHILECAAHQFEAGDVLHWWHPPAGRGVRTRCSDDLAWLPYAAATYVQATGDLSILHERVPYLEGAPLGLDEGDRYAHFDQRPESVPLIDHLERALDLALTQGPHGLPLIGSGDWNDGMDRVGEAGRGESIWLGWFLAVCADLLADMEQRLGRQLVAERWAKRASELRTRIEDSGWDGSWYRRAYDDEGDPLGSARNDECRIDSISQSWAMFAGGRPDRVRLALDSARRELVDPDARLARLLWPPFDKGPEDPGYIKAYPPGLRENGGQYAHAAAWLGLAFAKIGDGEAAHLIFSMISPIGRDTNRYRVEPYVVAGDIATAEPHTGRGGWTWYSGAAAWTWRLGIEGIAGLTLREGKLQVDPSLPPGWGGYKAVLRRPGGSIALEVRDPDKVGRARVELSVDGRPWSGGGIDFPADGSERQVVATLKP